jgi:hypothetical protein
MMLNNFLFKSLNLWRKINIFHTSWLQDDPLQACLGFISNPVGQHGTAVSFLWRAPSLKAPARPGRPAGINSYPRNFASRKISIASMHTGATKMSRHVCCGSAEKLLDQSRDRMEKYSRLSTRWAWRKCAVDLGFWED